MDILENFRILDLVDILLVATLLYYLYKLVKGTVAINIFLGICIIWVMWKITQLLQMEMLSTILGQFIGAGMFALIVVFQQEIRKFLLMIGSTNIGRKTGILKHFKFLHDEAQDSSKTKVEEIIDACDKMGKVRTGALIVIQRTTHLDFVKQTGDQMNIEVNRPILESIFFKNSTLHDGAVIIEDNTIVATRAILPVSNERNIPLRFGLRHRAAVGITEKTDAVALVVSEETGNISYLKDGEFVLFKNLTELIEILRKDLS
ncbi:MULTISPECIES: diadenylate cyclase CdaA [Leeuwenhoekiella]|uniref:Diadenylate cyclase n=1 Tax=Leeuwenhoekiella palythoae TaxID=573501 RepID=A0A1M5Z999_9FLAO|nr:MULTISPECIES: diadenylate cyclase CdaA [Leeuwenhoekiella]MBH12214.1 TIGR00159 family protein [Leeuwenhoekiella sp.]MEC7783871.1 diadenylate cyclase CdaA [Bacteroidota bacterium]MEC8683972.1 diadenylate cyclase CdaA [Bacteroidota bacterium]MEE3148043.1 diadenylate cyclase CdaA [Bacteroidota bacterium]MEE3245406.1 diadenylate cyclase CdaA [Bacteroidota bacterium]